jgi:hypothetical protein
MSAESNQADALRRIRDRGPMAWCEGKGRAGGAVSRLFDRMTSEGLCTRPPHQITAKGHEWLDWFDRMHPPKCLHCRKVEADHSASSRSCPIGRRHRTLGYTQFGQTKFFHHSVKG